MSSSDCNPSDCVMIDDQMQAVTTLWYRSRWDRHRHRDKDHDNPSRSLPPFLLRCDRAPIPVVVGMVKVQ